MKKSTKNMVAGPAFAVARFSRPSGPRLLFARDGESLGFRRFNCLKKLRCYVLTAAGWDDQQLLPRRQSDRDGTPKTTGFSDCGARGGDGRDGRNRGRCAARCRGGFSVRRRHRFAELGFDKIRHEHICGDLHRHRASRYITKPSTTAAIAAPPTIIGTCMPLSAVSSANPIN